MMVTGSQYDYLLITIIVLLILTITVTAIWPPHRHQFNRKIAEHWDYEGHHYECYQCACGKKRETFTPIDLEESL